MIWLPYVLVFYYTNKLSWLFRNIGADNLPERITNTLVHFRYAFVSSLPSMDLRDLTAGLLAALCLKGILVMRKQNRKNYRQGTEYGSARWGTAKDIAMFIDKIPENNIILTATESLTMNSRPKNPKYARNKNVLVIGGSGSGKTRFYAKPNIMQMHSSYCVTDPK